MKDPIMKVKEILTVLIRDYLKEFLIGVLSRLVKDTELISSENCCTVLEEEMKEFRTFHNQIISANTIDSNYQYTLIAEVHKHLEKYQIEFEEVEIAYDCKKDIHIPVPEAG